MTEMRRLLTILALSIALFASAGCSGVNDIKVTSCSIASVSPKGLKSLSALLMLGIENPIMAFTVSDLEGVINNNGREFATFEAGKLPVARKSSKVYPLTCSGSISKGVGLMDLIKLAGSKDFSGMTIDMKVKVKLKCGIGKTLRFKDLKVTDLMEPSVAAAYLDIIIDENII